MVERFSTPLDIDPSNKDFPKIKLKNRMTLLSVFSGIIIHSVAYLCGLYPLFIFIILQVGMWTSIIWYFMTKRNCENGTFKVMGFFLTMVPFWSYWEKSLDYFSMTSTLAVANVATLVQNRYMIITMGILQILFYNLHTSHSIKSQILSYGCVEDVITYFDANSWAVHVCMIFSWCFSLVIFEGVNIHRKEVADSMQKLRETNDMLQKTIERQDKLILSFSHELNNPLHALAGNLEKIKQHPSLECLHNLVNECAASLNLLQSLINNILDASKAEEKNVDICPQETNTKELFDDIWKICQTIIESKGLQAISQIPEDLPESIIIDKHRIKQMILNIVSNSVKFTDKGEVQMIISLHKHTSACSELLMPTRTHSESSIYKNDASDIFEDSMISINEQVLRIEIADTGCGLTREQLQNLFEKPTITQHSEGNRLKLGLSLWVTKRILEYMNGDINIFSTPGKGTSVVLTIKCKLNDPCRSLIKPSLGSFTSTTRKLRAMVVEDQSFNAQINRDYLEKCGVAVIFIAFNGKEAVDYFIQYNESGNSIDLILMDIEMPIMDGKEASRRIRQYEKQRIEQSKSLGEAPAKETEIIFLSGNCLETEIRECLDPVGEIRGHQFLRKPASVKDLKQIINKLQGTL
mgnify:CR=1 FL=1